MLVFWFSIALTESYKWRKDEGKPDSKLINVANYHAWRSVTSASVLLLCILNIGFLKGFLIYLIGNAIYERTMSYVEDGTIFAKREDFRIFSIYIPRPSPIVEISFFIIEVLLFLITIV